MGYTNRAMSERVAVDDLETWYSAGGGPVVIHLGRPFTGVAFEMSAGRLISELSYVDGVEVGPARTWHPNGVLESESGNLYNRAHGPFREWRADGSLAAEGTMELGHVVSRVDVAADGTVTRRWSIADDPEAAERLALTRRALGRA